MRPQIKEKFEQFFKNKDVLIRMIIIVTVVFVCTSIIYRYFPSKHGIETQDPQLKIEPIKEMTPKAAISIKPGIHNVYTQAPLVAPLKLITPGGTEKYYIKVVDAYTSAPLMTIFMVGGQVLEARVPLGSYKIRYATGEAWYGDKDLFGTSTSLNEAEKVLEFVKRDGSIVGYTVELIPKYLENSGTKQVEATQF